MVPLAELELSLPGETMGSGRKEGGYRRVRANGTQRWQQFFRNYDLNSIVG